MYKYSDIERILKKISDENPEEMEEIDEIDESVFGRIEANVLSELSNAKKTKKTKPRIYLRAAVAALGIIAVFSLAFYLIEMPAIRASKDPREAISSEDEISQAVKNEAKQNISLPEYIPEGYVLDEGYEGAGEVWVECKYINPADDSLFILITIDGEPVQPADGVKVIEEKEYNGLPLSILNKAGNPDENYVNFFSVHGYWAQITATLDYDTMMEIMVSME